MTVRTVLRSTTARVVFATAAFSANVAHAQAPTASLPSTAQASGTNDDGIIVVTAQRRAQSINDVPISIAVIDADTLASRGVKDLAGVSNLVSNTQLFDNGLGQPTWVIRGVGLLDFSPNNTPASAIYIDDVYQTSNAFGTVSLFDVDRVEVLKGPQGGLYGRNTSGGAVRIEIKRPALDKVEGSVSVGIERWQRVRGDAAVSVPIIADRVAIRLSGRGETSGSGWQTSIPTGQKWGKRERWSLRGQILAKLSDDVTARIVVDGGRDTSDLNLGSAIGTRSLAGVAPDFLCPALLAGRRDDTNCVPYGSLVNALFLGDPLTNLASTQSGDGRRVLADPVSALNNRSFGVSGYLTAAIGTAELTSITSFRKFDYLVQDDNDGSTGEFGHQQSASKFKVFSQDVRIASTGDSAVSWMIGGIFARDTIDEDRNFRFADNIPVIQAYGLTNPAQALANLRYRQRTTSWSGFGQIDYKLSDHWTIGGSARYSDETKSYRDGSFGFPVVGVLVGSNLADEYSLKSHWTGKFNVQYQPNKRSLVYASVSRGYKSGGFFGGFPLNGQSSIVPYKEETVTAYEVGFKWAAADRNLGANGAVFYYDYADAQGFASFNDPILGAISRLSNIGDARHIGAELDGFWEPVRGLRFSGSIGYLDAKIRNGATGQGVLGTSFSYSGQRRDYAPKWSWTAGVDYGAAIGNIGKLNLAVNANGRSTLVEAHGPDVIDDVLGFIGGYTLVDAQLGFKSNRGWAVGLYARNLLDTSYRLAQGSDGLNSNAEIFGEPRSYGLTASLDF
jgi:iron complex outermembrane recepter protein